LENKNRGEAGDNREYHNFSEGFKSTDTLEIVRHEAVQEMRVGPSESACRSRLQSTLSCIGKEPELQNLLSL
jgi:hypothetical protein